MIRAWPALLSLSFAVILGYPGPRAAGHELPVFPHVQVLAVRPDPFRPTSWFYAVHVLDPSGRRPVANADVRVSGFERRMGSAARLGSAWLAPTPTLGVYQGTVEFPSPGTWELTITVKGPYVGEAHTLAVVGSGVTSVDPPRDGPQLGIDRVLLRHLLLEWGHLAGFGLWLGVTALALVTRRENLKTALTLTWIALAVEGGTGLYMMQVGTSFPRALPIAGRDVPSHSKVLSSSAVRFLSLVPGVLGMLAVLCLRHRPHHEEHRERTCQESQYRKEPGCRAEQRASATGQDDDGQKWRPAAEGQLEVTLPALGLRWRRRRLRFARGLGAGNLDIHRRLDSSHPHFPDKRFGVFLRAECFAEALDMPAYFAGFLAAEAAVARDELRRCRQVPIF